MFDRNLTEDCIGRGLHPFFRAMGHRRGGGGRGVGPFGGGFFGGFGGPGGPGFGAGRKLMAADLQLLILSLLEEKPRHGYELIKALEEKSAGFYTPSPGVIYPALTYLEDMGFASVETSGTKKLYSLTPEGLEHLNANREPIEEMVRDLERIANKMSRMQQFFDRDERDEEESGHLRDSDEFHDARMSLRLAIKQKRHCSPPEAKRISEILRRAAAEILGRSES
jgi:DNA-binding PadR family transcriptional regulator